MSSIANWSYTYQATVTPAGEIDGVTGATQLGTPYTIMCNVTAVEDEKRQAAQSGHELVGKHVIYTEDGRPQEGDMIEFVGSNGKQKILHRTFWEMTAFNDTPDYKLVT